jgi:hypothetical protein
MRGFWPQRNRTLSWDDRSVPASTKAGCNCLQAAIKEEEETVQAHLVITLNMLLTYTLIGLLGVYGSNGSSCIHQRKFHV